MQMTGEEINTEFLRYKDAAYRYAVALLHDNVTAEDLTQDLYEKMWRRRLLIRQSGFRALMMTSMRNLCLDRLRQKRLTPLDNTLFQLESPPEPNGELTEIIHKLIKALPEREREVMHLRDIEQMEYEEIALITNSKESAVRMACSRARNRVKEELVKIINHGL